ncbi:MAG TPA: hypothetical protein VG838_02165 [Opitutaceae bacterium]|nr:hypothetical protein [Opitutaceae bacterium]
MFSRSFLPRLLAPCLLGIASWTMAGAAEAASSAAPAASGSPQLITSMREDVLRMSEFFNTMLPGTLSQYNVVLDFSPKFSDFRDNEFIRYPLELRYGLTSHTELFGDVIPYSPNPINSGRDHRWGPGEAQLGIRHNFGRIPHLFYDDFTVGFAARTPLGSPPVEINDHYTHLTPTISASRQLHWPHTTLYTTFSYDREVDGPAVPPIGVIRRHTTEIAPGVLYKPGEFGGFFDYTFRHFSQDMDAHLGHEFKLGGIWDAPLARTAKWGLPGKWQVELAYRYSTEEGVGRDQGLTARVHWRTTLREMLNQSPK